MGLDMYAYIGKPGQHDEYWHTAEFNQETKKFESTTVKEPKQLAYWRKHANLHGWFTNLWLEREGKDCTADDFNNVELELTWQDVDDLEKAVRKRQLPDTQGFFFGHGNTEPYRKDDLKFCREAKEDLFLGHRVFYNSSW